MTTVTETDLTLADGGTLHVYDTTRGDLPVLWHHGTPNTGLPPEPLFAASERFGLRWVSWDRPGYGGSTPAPGRPVSSAATYAAAAADALGLDRYAVMGHSGGGPHALACAALAPDRVVAAVAVASMAPYDGGGLDYTHGMCASGAAALGAAAAGLEAREAHEVAHGDDYDPEFTDADEAALGGEWGWFVKVVRAAAPSGLGARDRRRCRLRGPLGVRPGAGQRTDAPRPRRTRPDRPTRSREVAGRPDPARRAAPLGGRRAHLGDAARRAGPRLAGRAPPLKVDWTTCVGEGFPATRPRSAAPRFRS